MDQLSGYVFSPLREGDFALQRGSGNDLAPILLVTADETSPGSFERLEHEYALKSELDADWAARPVVLAHDNGRMTLVLEDPGGTLLDRLLGQPLDLSHFLRIAIPLAGALGHVHERGLIHKDIKPANILVESASGDVWLTGFGIASRLPRERQAPAPPEVIAGTLAYMAPEQTGRMNRSIDSRSDLYALGVTFYQMLTGSLPFTAVDPMEWVHCHIARKPLPPSERLENIPAAVSEIIMKLLAKTAEERYQTTAGVESDLRHCLSEWERKGLIAPFALGEHDAPDRLLLPEKLYGRAREIETLLACFDGMVNGGAAELVLVSGYSGIGKSSVVNELHKVLVPPRGLFASGKFDQYKRDIPYSTLAQAFQSLIRPLLGKSDPELAGWREAFREALGPNGRLIIDLVPELRLIVGDQPPVPELPPHDAQRRFQLVFRRFLAVFARPEHPLALFLDDLQWLDSATLDLLEDLLTQPDVQHLMLIGAYRDNEVNCAHPLIRKLEAIRKAGAVVHEIILAPLAREDLEQLIGDALHGEPEHVTALAELIQEKTAGNPFFASQLLSVLVEEGLLTFNYGEGRWSWDLNRIRAKGYTDNVVDLMVGKLNRLPAETQQALQLLACMGSSPELSLLEMASQQSIEEMHGQLWEAVRAALIFRSEHSYKFLHDRVQEAAYSWIPEDARAEAHLRIGRLLATSIAPEEREEAIFEIVNQLNRGTALIASQDEREQVAALNLIAGKRAKASSAYASALTYLTVGAALLLEDAWERRQELAFALELHRADCELWMGALSCAEERLAALASRAADTVQRAAVASRRVDLFTILGSSDRAVEIGLEYLRHVGIDWVVHPTEIEARREYERIWSQLGSRAIEDIIDLPLMEDPESLATLDVLSTLGAPGVFTDQNLHTLMTCRAVNLSLERGNSDVAPSHYVALGLMAGDHFGDYNAGYRLAKMACDLTERRGLKRLGGKTYSVFALVVPWTRPVREAIDAARLAFQMANEQSDPTFAAYACRFLTPSLFASGEPLDQVAREAEHGLEFSRKMGFEFGAKMIFAPLALVRMLRGETAKFGSFDHNDFSERAFEERMTGKPALALPECIYWIRKLQAHYFASDYASAVEAAEKAEGLFSTSISLWIMLLVRAEYHLYAALSCAACCEPMGPDPYAKHRETLAAHEAQLRGWAANCPANFESCAALLSAEIARIEGRELDAERLYERAIGSARANGFIHNEALAFELAARFYAARGFGQFAHLYLRSARYGYLRWGAAGKVRQLDSAYPDLGQEESPPGPTSTINAQVERLDFATVMKVLQAVASDTGQENLIDTLMHIAMEQAGAERALLINPCGDKPRIEAEATTSGDTVTVRLLDEAATEHVLPKSVMHYVLRTSEIAILDDAVAQSPFGVDSYISQWQARSILCLPLLNQAKLIGVLYLENNLAPRVFAPTRVSVLKLLASQAAIALENARLYRDGRVREAKIRRLVDSNIIGIVIGDFEGRVLEANDEFLRMVSYDREDLVSGRIKWTDLTAPDWRDRNNAMIERQKSSGRFEPFEKEYVRKDGSRVPVLIGGATFEEGGNQGVAFVLDLTERKRAEEALRESEYKLRQIVETVPSLLWSTDPDGEVTHVNQRFLDYSGMRLQDFKHGGWEALMRPDDYAEIARTFYHAIQTETSYEDVMRLRRADGEFRWHQVRGEPLRDRQGRIIQWYGLSVDVDERKKVEEQLQRSESYLAEAERLSHSGSAAYDETKILYLSEEAHRMFGFDPAQGVPSREAVAQRIHPDDRDRLNAEVQRAVGEKRKYWIEYRIVLPDGTVKHLEAIGQPVFSASGKLVEIVSTQIDVTERKLAEQALRESEYKHRQILETVPALLWSLAPDGEQTYFNQRMLDYFGRPFEDFTHGGWGAFLHPDDLAEAQASFSRDIQSGASHQNEFRLRRADGEFRWHQSRCEPLRDQQGHIVQWYGLTIDIDERKRAEQALRESERSLRLAIDGIDGLVGVLAPNGELQAANRQLFAYFGRSLEELKNWGTNDIVHPEDLPRILDLVMRGVASEIPFNFELRVRRFDGEYRWFENRHVPILDESGRIARWYLLLTDIEDRTRALARLDQLQSDFAHMNRISVMGELVASLSHEISQPIASARNNARAARNFLDMQPPDLGEVREALAGIVGNTGRAGDIIDRIRDQIRKAPPRNEQFDLNAAIDEVIVLGRSAIIKNRVWVQTRLSAALFPVYGDRVQLQQVVLNLLLNAVEAMGSVEAAPRELLISTRQDHTGVLVAVHDSGPGIDPEQLDRIFNSFYTTKPSGTGMGLAICRSIIDAHGGRLWAEANEPCGTIFQFTVPGTERRNS